MSPSLETARILAGVCKRCGRDHLPIEWTRMAYDKAALVKAPGAAAAAERLERLTCLYLRVGARLGQSEKGSDRARYCRFGEAAERALAAFRREAARGREVTAMFEAVGDRVRSGVRAEAMVSAAKSALGLLRIPPRLKAALVAAVAKHTGRLELKLNTSLPSTPAERLAAIKAGKRNAAARAAIARDQRLMDRMIPALGEAYRTCGYRRAGSKWVGGAHVVEWALTVSHKAAEQYEGVSASGVSEKAWHKKHAWSGTNSTHTFRVARDWLETVHARGLATYEGCLVLAAREEEGAIWLRVVAGGRGVSLVLKDVRLDKEEVAK